MRVATMEVLVVGGGCSPGKYQLKFDAQETCYLLKGKVKVYRKNSSEFVDQPVDLFLSVCVLIDETLNRNFW
ncbi:hypothetical protein QVD17_24096 [Tagetes erecta]|uniref:(S)-ureidoglycine aminohydrolase cupin domain-containing protein n=1 Tax=Tagetes erecta TaxID=13708 RepID=A0AAD8KI80_TARER|nr:hypothetical protein QVD17_24096 [Tagetes erecta]